MRIRATILIGCLSAGAPDAVAIPPESPGVRIGVTAYEVQHNYSMGHQATRRSGAELVHFMWTAWFHIPNSIDDVDRSIGYNAYSTNSQQLLYGSAGADISLFCELCVSSRPGYVDITTDADNAVHGSLHQSEDPALGYSPWRLYFPSPGSVLYITDELRGWDTLSCREVLWPRIANSGAEASYDHIVSIENTNNCDRNLIYYWRCDDVSGIWEGPVVIDSATPIASYVITSDPNSARCAIVLHSNIEPQFAGISNVAIYESSTSGTGWLNGGELGSSNKQFISNYNLTGGPSAGNNLAAEYDNDGVLHVVWDELRPDNMWGNFVTIKHWNLLRGAIRTVTNSNWSIGGQFSVERQLDKVTVGIGDGSTTCGGTSNLNFLYLVYTRFGGPTDEELSDVSLTGYSNGELYLSASADGGNSWATPVNLTNTKTPNCNPGTADPSTDQPLRPDSVCRSENWASINKVVHDIDIVFISDLDAGAIPYEQGTWQLNPVHYLRLPGGTTNAQFLCPENVTQLVSVLTVPESDLCGMHSSGSDTLANASLDIQAFGGEGIEGRVRVAYTEPTSPTANWLTINGLQVELFSFDSLNMLQSWNRPVTMAPTGLSRGVYKAELRIERLDSTQAPFDIFPITFNVDPCGCHADPICDGLTNVQDVIRVVDVAFRGLPYTLDPFCSPTLLQFNGISDVDCSGETNITDVVLTVNVAFRGMSSLGQFCAPCTLPAPDDSTGSGPTMEWIRQSNAAH